MKPGAIKSVLVIVAHPDDETLWAGGTILSHPEWNWFIVCLSRKSDSDRATRFYRALKVLGVDGIMGNMDDGPEQVPLAEWELKQEIIQLLPSINFDLVITHNPSGEYTRHIRHEETSRAVIELWNEKKIIANELWTFAYDDDAKQHFPQALKIANIFVELPEKIWNIKYSIITKEFGFDTESWEAKTTPKGEAFWQFTKTTDAMHWLSKGGL